MFSMKTVHSEVFGDIALSTFFLPPRIVPAVCFCPLIILIWCIFMNIKRRIMCICNKCVRCFHNCTLSLDNVFRLRLKLLVNKSSENKMATILILSFRCLETEDLLLFSFYIIVNWMSLDFRPLIGQNKQTEAVSFGVYKMLKYFPTFSNILQTKQLIA